MRIDPENSKHIIADNGKVFQRIVSKENYGEEIYLGYSYYIGGALQTHFEEIDKPEDEIIDSYN